MSTPLQDMRQLLQEDPRFKVEAYQFIREALQYASENIPSSPDKFAADKVPSDKVSSDKVSSSGQSGSPLPAAAEDDAAGDAGAFEELVFAEAREDDSLELEADHASAIRTRHITGEQLCHACRQYATEQYGFLANMVLSNWGVHSTSDLGDLVYNLIRIGQMRKSESDRREDFNDVYEFESAFEPQFELATSAD